MKRIKVKIKKIWGQFREPRWFEKNMTPKVMYYKDKCEMKQKGFIYRYDFEQLEKELLNETTPNKPIEVFEIFNASEMPKTAKERKKYFGAEGSSRDLEFCKHLTGYDYAIHNGNHRCYVLEKLYGEDYMIECTLLDMHPIHKQAYNRNQK
jgi:hypothetical protein